MKTTNIEILEITNFLTQFESKKLPQKISYAIMRNLTIYSTEQKLYQEALQKLLSKYDEYIVKDEEGNTKTLENGLPEIKEEKAEDFYGELNDLLLIEVEIKPYYIDKEVFDYDDSKNNYDLLSAKDLYLMMSILCEPEKEEKEEEEKEAE